MVRGLGVFVRALVLVGVGPVQGGLGLVLGVGAPQSEGVEAAEGMNEFTRWERSGRMTDWVV